jgi:signal transduction histidine kinase
VETTDEFEEAVSRGQAATIADVSSLQLPLETGEHVSAPGLRQALLVPLIGRSDPVGVLSLVRGNDGKDAFSDRDMRLTQMVADSFAIAVENDRLHLLERQQAADRERDRLARDLHDAVTQSIYSASLIAEALPAVWERSSDEGLKNLERLRILVRGALSEMRTLLFELRPSTLQHADLYMLVEHLANALAGQTQIPVDVRMQEEARLPVEVKITLYRVAQEAFSNIAKHARASRVSISLGTDHEQVVMRIEDDGCGFDQSAVPSGHMGIQIIRERLDQIGAALLIDSAVGRGTTVTVVWPRPDPD